MNRFKSIAYHFEHAAVRGIQLFLTT